MGPVSFMPERTGATRKVMVVADPGREFYGALQWALSHCLLERDTLILLHVESNSKRNAISSCLKHSHMSHGDHLDHFLKNMKTKCEAAQPKVKVRVERVQMEGRDKASTILSQTLTFSVDLLVVGQRRCSNHLGRKLSGSMSNKGPDTTEYLIENSKCLCVGVHQKKGQNAGYLLNSKTHRNFWLLA